MDPFLAYLGIKTNRKQTKSLKVDETNSLLTERERRRCADREWLREAERERSVERERLCDSRRCLETCLSLSR
jgi:hypothetical protein